MADKAGLGYSAPMSPKRVSHKLPSPADIVGLPASQLADMLDDILADHRAGPPAAEFATGLLGLAETLRDSLALPPQADGHESTPVAGAEDLLPELRIVETLLANIPREHRAEPVSPRRDDTPTTLASPFGSPAENSGVSILPQATAEHDLEAIRLALRPFAGETLPESIFHEVMALTAALSGRTYLPPAAPVQSDAQGDHLLAQALAIQTALNDLGTPPPEVTEPVDEPPPATADPVVETAATQPATGVTVKVRSGQRSKKRRHEVDAAPVTPAPIPPEPECPAEPEAPTEPPTERRPRTVKLRLKDPAAAVVTPPEPVPPGVTAPEPPGLPQDALPQAEEIAKPLKVNVKPSRRRKSPPASPPPPAPAVAAVPEAAASEAAEVMPCPIPVPDPELEPAAEPEPEPVPEPEPAAASVSDVVAPPEIPPELPPEPQPELTPAPEAEPDVQATAEDEDVLLLTEEVPAFAEDEAAPDAPDASTAEQMGEMPPSPIDEPEPDLPPEAAAGDSGLAALVEAVIAAHIPAGTPRTLHGDQTLPERTDALEALLADPPPATDFAALDLLTACWGKNAHGVTSRALLAAAQNLSRNFGLPGKLPMASCRAWKMLDAETFQDELADRLGAVGAFIADWQRSQRTFLILEFGEIELIEYLFEALHPAHHLDLLANVMNFKVLSNRRMGLLRRIPTRLRKQVQPMLPGRFQEALVLLAHSKALLEKIADPNGFPPIIDTAGKALEEIDKLMKQAASAGAPPLPGPPGGGGMALGRIG